MKFIHTLFYTVVLYMLCSCQYGSFTNNKQNDSDSLAIHIAILPTNECEPFRMAMGQGLFDSLGVEVCLDTFMSAMDADTAFMNGSVHMLVTDSVKTSFLQAQLNGDSLISVVSDSLTLSVMTTKSSRIKSISNLKERIIAVARNSAVDHYADKIMDQAKINREFLNRPQINNIALRAKMLNLNQYDGAILPEPFATECEKKGANRIATSTMAEMRVIVKKTTYKKYNEEINKIIIAYTQAHGKQQHI